MDAVLFDLGNVLISIHPEKALARVGELCGKAPDEVFQHIFHSGLWSSFEDGSCSESELVENFSSFAGKPLALVELKNAACAMFSPRPEMERLLGAVLAARSKVALVSNTNHWHWEHVSAQYAYVNTISHLSLSYEVGSNKPDKGIYLHAAKALGVEPSQCLFIDDLPENIAGARNLGMQAVLFESAEKLEHSLTTYGIL